MPGSTGPPRLLRHRRAYQTTSETRAGQALIALSPSQTSSESGPASAMRAVPEHVERSPALAPTAQRRPHGRVPPGRVPQGPTFQPCRLIRSCRPEAPCSGRNPLLGSSHGRIVISRGFRVLRSLAIRSKSHRGASQVGRTGPVDGRALLGSLPALRSGVARCRGRARFFRRRTRKLTVTPPPRGRGGSMQVERIRAVLTKSTTVTGAQDRRKPDGRRKRLRGPERAMIANYQTTPESRWLACRKSPESKVLPSRTAAANRAYHQRVRVNFEEPPSGSRPTGHRGLPGAPEQRHLKRKWWTRRIGCLREIGGKVIVARNGEKGRCLPIDDK
jgi:hypothetical protein